MAKCHKITLNASKIEFVIFRLEEHLYWKPHIFTISTKLQRANGILSRLCRYLPLNLLVDIYHSIFGSHMSYSCQIWGCDNKQILSSHSNTSKRLKKLHCHWSHSVHLGLSLILFSLISEFLNSLILFRFWTSYWYINNMIQMIFLKH